MWLGAIAEMGAMRVPPSCKLFFRYADAFGLKTSGFPDPGKVLTALYYENARLNWEANAQNPPGLFTQINTDFGKFASSLTGPLNDPWKKGDLAGVRRVWQSYIDKYTDLSYLSGIAQGIPQWQAAQLNAFGALGIGSGGFGPLYPVCFLEILRVIVNQWETDQQLIQFGINELAEKFYSTRVKLPNGQMASLEDKKAVRLRTEVTGLAYRGGNPVVNFRAADGTKGEESFPAVIVATTSHAMEFMGLSRPVSGAGDGLFSTGVKAAVRNLPMMNSSKLFIRTKTKFWQGRPTMPQNIQTDELPRAVYCLDYPQTENGVVLISYTWGDDSTRLIAAPPEERFRVFREIIAVIDKDFAAELNPVDDQIINIDWETQQHYYGAFKLDFPGGGPDTQAAYYQFLDCLNPAADKGVYLAGDSVSFAGGWTEGALETGLNAAVAAAKRIGAVVAAGSPLSQKKDLYDYGGSLDPAATNKARAAKA